MNFLAELRDNVVQCLEGRQNGRTWRYGQVVRQWIANPRFPSSNLGAAL
jgi:hypothetical protein